MLHYSNASTATRKYRNMKARLRTHGGVATLAKAYSLRCGLRLALGTKPSLSSRFSISRLKYWRGVLKGKRRSQVLYKIVLTRKKVLC
jgi:hypothetical protein